MVTHADPFGPQMPLGISLAPGATFEAWFVGQNRFAVEVLRGMADGTGERQAFLASEPGLGKSHLLQATCRRAGDAGARCAWLPLDGEAGADAGILEGLEALDLIALDAIDAHEAVGRPVKPFTTLVRNAVDVTDDLVTRWQTAAEHVVGERLYEGIAGWTGQTAWTAHEGAAIYLESDRATAWFIDEHITGDVSDDVEATIQDIYREALLDAVADHRDHRTPHLDYAAEVVLKD
jgi:hypothetical protein